MIIETRDLLKTYELGGQTIRALDGVSIGIDSGEMVAIMGPSGSGKSTLMHILGCLDQPDGGQYLLRGDNIAGLTPDELAAIRNKYISFVFQTFNLLPRMSAQENVALPLLYGGAKDANARAAEALARVGLGDRMHHEPNQLSGGQRQRVAIARAIVTDPTLMLADEPTGNLDSRTGDEIMELFSALNREGRTIVVVTHEPDIAVRCPRCIRIHDGKVLSDGPSAEVAAGYLARV